MKTEEVQNLIEKSILSGKQIVIKYTNSKGVIDKYLINAITSTWSGYFITSAMSLSKGKTKPFNKFRYDRISSVDITDASYHPNDHLLDKLRDASLFSEIDNRIDRRGGLKGYPSSLNYISDIPQKLNKSDAQKLINEISIPSLDGLIRGIVLNIEDGDTYDLLLESDTTGSYVTRLFGVDAPELKEDSIDFVLGFEAKIFIEDIFKNSRYCYVRRLGIDSFKRHLMDIFNVDKKDIALELLENGLGLPMMAYVEDINTRKKYELATKSARERKKGVWSINGLSEQYENIITDCNKSKIDVSKYIPEKKSAFAKYLKDNPKANIINKAFFRKDRNVSNTIIAKEIFNKMTLQLQLDRYDLESYKTMCDLFLKEINKLEQLPNNVEQVKDCTMHIEDMVDELNLGEGIIKGNFSKGKNKLLYHADPEHKWYKLCIPEILFRTIDDAKYCGFKKGS
ncbi:thermonuclease family protein [Nitrospinae bacterium]|nr:thermonuclease family protein [Nitrospinota bacterium]